MCGCDKTQHKRFLTDLGFLGAFSKDILAWGPGALSTNARDIPAFDMSGYIPCDRVTSRPPDRRKQIGRISTPRRFEVAKKTVPPHLPYLAEQTAQGVRIQILFPLCELGGEVTVGYECNIHDPQSRHLTAEECALIAMMEAGPTDPEKASQLELPDKHKFFKFTSFYTETLLVQTPKAGIRVDISRDTVGKRILVEKGTKLEVHLMMMMLLLL